MCIIKKEQTAVFFLNQPLLRTKKERRLCVFNFRYLQTVMHWYMEMFIMGQILKLFKSNTLIPLFLQKCTWCSNKFRPNKIITCIFTLWFSRGVIFVLKGNYKFLCMIKRMLMSSQPYNFIKLCNQLWTLMNYFKVV